MATLDTAEILIDFDGKVNYLTPTTLEVYNESGLDLGITGVFGSGYSDLGEPSVDKLLNAIDIDYVGQCNIFFSFQSLDGTSATSSIFTLPSKASRGTYWLQLPLAERRAFQKIAYWFTEPTHGTKIYGLEIDFSILKRRRIR